MEAEYATETGNKRIDSEGFPKNKMWCPFLEYERNFLRNFIFEGSGQLGDGVGKPFIFNNKQIIFTIVEIGIRHAMLIGAGRPRHFLRYLF
jgi:hypothetical protein